MTAYHVKLVTIGSILMSYYRKQLKHLSQLYERKGKYHFWAEVETHWNMQHGMFGYTSRSRERETNYGTLSQVKYNELYYAQTYALTMEIRADPEIPRNIYALMKPTDLLVFVYWHERLDRALNRDPIEEELLML